LFTEEAPVVSPLRGSDDFARGFAAKGPRDKQGRSLRDFELQTRLFKYPCSFLIYSEAFESLPDVVKARIYERLWDILSGKDTAAEWQKIPDETRQAIREILVDTKPGLPDYWKAVSSAKR
jgi:hypothetical protein